MGKAAKNQAVTNPKNTVFSIKRFMGRKYSECTSEIKTVPYEVKEARVAVPSSTSRARITPPSR